MASVAGPVREPVGEAQDLQGNGYQFTLRQINFATLAIKCDCFLLQKVLDLPPGTTPTGTAHFADDVDARTVSVTVVGEIGVGAGQ